MAQTAAKGLPLTQAELMDRMKVGLGAIMSTAKSVQGTVTDPEMLEKTKKGMTSALNSGSQAMAATGEKTKQGLDYVAKNASSGAAVVSEKASTSMKFVGEKLEEVGVTQKAKEVGGYVYKTGSTGLTAANAYIDSSQNLSYAKNQTTQAASAVSSYVSSLWGGWGGGGSKAKADKGVLDQKDEN